jgi:hypothetical protein
MVQQNRNIMTLMKVLAHASSLRRKRRGIYPQVIKPSFIINTRPQYHKHMKEEKKDELEETGEAHSKYWTREMMSGVGISCAMSRSPGGPFGN